MYPLALLPLRQLLVPRCNRGLLLQKPAFWWVFSLVHRKEPTCGVQRRLRILMLNIDWLDRMRETPLFLSASFAKLGIALVLGLACGTTLLVSPSTRDVDEMQRAWEELWPFRSAVVSVPSAINAANVPLPSISAGTKYYAVSQNAKGLEDLEFDKKVTLFIETSQARIDLLVATLESNPSRAKSCANTLEGSVCSKLNSIMTDAVTSLDQADLAIESYQQKKGIVADPVLARLQKQVKELKQVSARYPGIGPKVEP